MGLFDDKDVESVSMSHGGKTIYLKGGPK